MEQINNVNRSLNLLAGPLDLFVPSTMAASTGLTGEAGGSKSASGGELPGGKVGRGSENNIPFIAAVQTNDQGHPCYAGLFNCKEFQQRGSRNMGKNAL